VSATAVREIGLLSLTRFGDLIQTSPITSGLRRRHPDARIHLIVKRRFKRVAEILPGVDVVHEIDGDALARALSSPDVPFIEPFRMARRIADGLAEIPFDLLFNFTHSRASAVLLSLLRARHTVGFKLDRSGTRRVDDSWLIHIGTLVRARRLIRLNLVDAYLGAAGLLGCGERLGVNVPESARGFASARLSEPGPYLAVQLGASQDHKTWSVKSYAATLDALRRRVPGLTAVVLGVGAERERAEELRRSCPEVRLKVLVGETSVEELAAVLERCQLLLTGDTGTMHLAAAVGTKTCAVFVGLGNPYETGVYAQDHVTLRSRIACSPCSHIVRCGFPACHGDLPPDWVADLVARMLLQQDLRDLPALPRAELLRTSFDEQGMLELVPLHARSAEPHDLLALAYQVLFVERLGARNVAGESVWRRAERFHGVARGAWRAHLPAELEPALAELEALGRDGAERAARLPRRARSAEELRAAGRELAELDARIYALGRAQPLLAPLCLALEGESESLPDADLPQVASASASNYRQLARGVARLRELIDGDPAPIHRAPLALAQESHP
jgi:ADP-heptose:LPS heptosyltransferase